MPDQVDDPKREEWKNYSLGHYPDMPPAARPWVALSFLAMITLGTIAGCLTGYSQICFIAALIAAVCLFCKACPLRCPQCKGPVVTRREDFKQGEDRYYQHFHDCANCEITWIGKKRKDSDAG